MAEYIEKEAAIHELIVGDWMERFVAGKCTVRDIFDDLPAADVRENVRGKWQHLGGDEWLCPACGHVIYTEGSWEHPRERGALFCENCGADMRGEGNGNKK